MSTPELSLPPDQPAREAIVRERQRNVAVMAGAGTGKTKTIIDRAVELLAPADDNQPVPIGRLAAITFTRRAAGELRFRMRERLLLELEGADPGPGPRVRALADALSNLDAAFIGTIHGFADRLLRLRPVEARLSPAYVLIEDNSELISETFLRLRRGAEAGTLADELGAHGKDLPPDLIGEAPETLRAATRAGLQMERRENIWGPVASVEMMFASMIDARDVRLSLPPVPDPGLEDARAAARRLNEMQRTMKGNALGHRRVRRMIRALQNLSATSDPAEAVRIVTEAQRGRDLYKARDFEGDGTGWDLYNLIRGQRHGIVTEQLRGPHRWLAARLVRLCPVVCAMYQRVKDEHEVVDYLDLLIKLRDLLRDDRDARRFYQGLFDHVFVDEFQDTDPLQCEIVFYLCEDGAEAEEWSSARLRPGKLTIVGDPKQSIYRFRRADITMYGRALDRLRRLGALEERLETNFRSRPELIRFFNEQLARVLGEDPERPFEPETGRANYEPLRAAESIPVAGKSVHVVRYADDAREGLVASNGRSIEGAALARYIAWLLRGGLKVRDPETAMERAVTPSDVAVLATVTTNLRFLLQELDRLEIEHTVRGGSLFLAHPTVRRFLLALRAIADRDDGVALAALLQPPFFALDWNDVVAGRCEGAADPDPRRQRYDRARDLIKELRQQRNRRTPGATARDLIERTALGRTVAVGQNGRQILAALYEVAAELDRRAGVEGLDFDSATVLLRTWAEQPVYLDAAEPLGNDAVRVLTIHQAKGLEFPVVILWDGFQTFREPGAGVWRVDREGQGWALRLGQISIEHPPSCGLLDRERDFGEHERRRLYYVAATRARDLLVLPVPLAKSERLNYATRELAANVDPDLVREFAVFSPNHVPDWARPEADGGPIRIIGDDELQEKADQAVTRLAAAIADSSVPRSAPAAVTLEALHEAQEQEDLTIAGELARKAAGARHGLLFGRVVHRALELLLGRVYSSEREAVQVAARELGASNHLREAQEDVKRSVEALRRLEVIRPEWTLRTEYPLCFFDASGKLVNGVIDLLAIGAERVLLLDFKTDHARPGDLQAAYPIYARQLELYERAIRQTGLLAGRDLQKGLLFSETGEVRWAGGLV